MPEPVIAAAIVLVRLLQYAGASVLFGTALFFALLAPPVWPRRLLAGAAAVLALASLAAIVLQARLFADALTIEAIGQTLAFLALAKAALVRAALAGLALAALLLGARRVAVALGALAALSLAWLGHGAALDGPTLLLADLFHVLTATAWLGALAGFALLLAGAGDAASLARLHTALRGFSALGVPLVAVLALSGLVNGAYTVGWSHLADLPDTAYGRLLLAKLIAFALMLALAARNRAVLTPALAADPGALARLRRSIGAEAALGLAVLALVAWLGTLEPPASI